MKPCWQFYLRFRRTCNRLLIYVAMAVSTQIVETLATLLDQDGIQVRHPSFLWWVMQAFCLVQAVTVTVRAMIDGSLAEDRERANRKETNETNH